MNKRTINKYITNKTAPVMVASGAERSIMQHINMEEFANGAFTAQINREIQKVTENIQDPNTDATAKRRVTVVIEFKPNEARNFVTTGVQAKSTLAPALGAVTALNMGKNLKTGEVEAVEIGNQLPGQLSIMEPDSAAETIRTVDPSTGEIYDTPVENKANEGKVYDLRKAKQA